MRIPPFTLLLVFIGTSTLIQATEFRADFSDGLGLWQKSPSGSWEINRENNNPVAALTQAGEQLGGVRRPTGFLLLPQFTWTDYTFSLRAKTLEPATTVNRDVVLIFGYQDPSHFYYVHVSSNSDDKFHNIVMKVDGENRSTIDQQVLPEARLTGKWHHIKVDHESNGTIHIYVDDMVTPLMTAEDSTYPAGVIGFGCFDDRALFDDVIVSGKADSAR